MIQHLYEQAATLTAEELRLAENCAPANLEVFVPDSLYRVASACGDFIHVACAEVPEASLDHPFWSHLTNQIPTPISNPRIDTLPVRSGTNTQEKRADDLFIATEDDVLKVESAAKRGSQSLRITRYDLAEGQVLSDYTNMRMTRFNDFTVFGSSVLLPRTIAEFRRGQGVVGANIELFRGFKDNRTDWNRMSTYGSDDQDHSEIIHATFLKEASAAIDAIHNFVSK